MTPLVHLRTICLDLPEAAERETWEHPTFRVREKIFAMYVTRDRPALWCKAPKGVQQLLLEADSARFFRPPYVGPKGWIGVYLDTGPDWAEVADLVARSWSMTAPKRLVRPPSAAGSPGAGA